MDQASTDLNMPSDADRERNAFAKFEAQVKNLELKETLDRVTNELFTAAKSGDAGSFELLVQLAKNASFKVFEAAQVRSDVASHIARQTTYWPILLSTSDKLNRANAQFVEQLGLGAECSSPISVEKTFKGDTPLRKVALTLVYVTTQLRKAWDAREKLQEMHAFLQSSSDSSSQKVLEERRLVRSLIESISTNGVKQGRAAMAGLAELASVLGTNPGNMNKVSDIQMREAHNLPPLSAESLEQWFQFGLDIILLATDDEPESSPFLRSLGDYRKDKYPKLLAAMENGGEVVASEVLKIKQQGRAKKTADSNFWDGVTTKLRRVYEKVISC